MSNTVYLYFIKLRTLPLKYHDGILKESSFIDIHWILKIIPLQQNHFLLGFFFFFYETGWFHMTNGF